MASLKSLPISIPEKMSQVAAEWSSLSPNSRQEFERYAEADKVRYFDEMKTYSGPMHVPNKRTKKPPVRFCLLIHDVGHDTLKTTTTTTQY